MEGVEVPSATMNEPLPSDHMENQQNTPAKDQDQEIPPAQDLPFKVGSAGTSLEGMPLVSSPSLFTSFCTYVFLYLSPVSLGLLKWNICKCMKSLSLLIV